MKNIGLTCISIFLIAMAPVKAQGVLQGNTALYTPGHSVARNNNLKDSIIPNKKWFVTKYLGIESSMSFFKGGHATVLSVPVGIQLNRRLSKNWVAFANITAAPAYVNFNQSFLNTSATKTFQSNSIFNNGNHFDMYGRASMGLMYTNDQKTFSISGSISVERSNYPLLFSPVATGTGLYPMYRPY